MSSSHCIRCYTPREWLFVLLLICLSGYVVHNEHRAGILVHAELTSIGNAQLQQQLIELNQQRVELLYELMFMSHRLPQDYLPFPDAKPLAFERGEQSAVDTIKEEE